VVCAVELATVPVQIKPCDNAVPNADAAVRAKPEVAFTPDWLDTSNTQTEY
jgi:hypothetical protein